MIIGYQMLKNRSSPLDISIRYLTAIIAITISYLFCNMSSARAQTLVSSDGRNIYVARLDRAVEEFNIGSDVLAVAANSAHIYALINGGNEVAQIGLTDGKEKMRFTVPCCGNALAVTDDDVLLAVTAETVPGAGQVHIFDTQSQKWERSFSLIGTPEKVAAHGCEFIIVSPDEREFEFRFTTHPTSFFLSIVSRISKGIERSVPGLFSGYVSELGLVLSLDLFAKEVVLTYLESTRVERIPFVDHRFLQGPSNYPSGITFNDALAHVIHSRGRLAGVIDLATGRLTQTRDIFVPCCDFLVGMSKDPLHFLVGLSDFGGGAVLAINSADSRIHWSVGFQGHPQYMFVDGNVLFVVSRYIDRSSENDVMFLTISRLYGEVLSRKEIPQLQIFRAFLTPGGTWQRDVGPVAFVPGLKNGVPGKCSESVHPPTSRSSSGCSVHMERPPHAIWMCIVLALVLCSAWVRSRMIPVAVAVMVAGAADFSSAKVISDAATLRFDLEEQIHSLPQPNGPALSRDWGSSPS